MVWGVGQQREEEGPSLRKRAPPKNPKSRNPENTMSRIPAIDPSTTTGTVKTPLDGVRRGIGSRRRHRETPQAPESQPGLGELAGCS